MAENVTQKKITKADIEEAERLEMDVETIMRLVDLMFLAREDGKVIPS